ncbi:hypothetical protein [Anaerococcus porci]|nr:hypothetical protein [Anaerococcus porci]MDY3005615.1 hypothetical protein [Anaerococcus porci]
MRLKKSLPGEFVPVNDGNKTLFGGYQNMLGKLGVSKFYRDRSCVVTAFTNVYLYLFRPDEKFSFEDYNHYHYWFFKILRPKIYGIPTARILDFKLNRLRKSYYLRLKSHILEDIPIKRKSIDEISSFINYAISHDLPLIFFNWLSPKIKFLAHHGVTITEIIKKDDDYVLTISSWGRLYRLSLKEFLS